MTAELRYFEGGSQNKQIQMFTTLTVGHVPWDITWYFP